MTIEFETPKPIAQQQYVLQTVAENMMRSVSREMDENEHAVPYGYIEFMHQAMKATGAGSLAPAGRYAERGGCGQTQAPADRLPDAGAHAGDALLGRRGHLSGHTRGRAGRSRRGSRRHARAESRSSWRASAGRNPPLPPCA